MNLRLLIAIPCLLLSVSALALDLGQAAPEFNLPALNNGNTTSLTNYKNKVIYLDFWASWCAPCRLSFPLLNALHQKLKHQGFEVIAINLDEDKSKAEQFLKEIPVDFTVLRDSSGEWADQYAIESMPTSFIIDQQGHIQHIHHGFTSPDISGIEQKIAQLLGKKAQ